MAQRRRAARKGGPPQERIILDSGALIGLASGDRRVMAFIRLNRQDGGAVFVPAVAVAETSRGGNSDANLNRVMKIAHAVLDLTEPVARTAGALLGRARSSATIDAIVVAHAIHLGGAVLLTSDPQDLRLLAGGQQGVRVIAV